MSDLKAADPPLKRAHELVNIGDHRAALTGLERGHGLQFRLAHGRDHLVAVAPPLVGEMDALDAFVVLAASPKRSRPWDANTLMTLFTVWRGNNVYAQISRCDMPSF